MNGGLLVRALRDPASLGPDTDWSGLVSAARAEQLAGTLAMRMAGCDVPPRVAAIFASARRDAAYARTQALWEAEMARRALADLDVPVVLLKGTAFYAADLDACAGRSVGDLDILVPRADIERVEQALLAAGWERLKPADGYDDQYYRQWMHEIAPLIHRTRDRMIDVHHTILPLTARPTPDAESLIADSVELESGLRILAPADIIVHAAAHLIADGDLAGGLRNLWDIDRLLRQFAAADPAFWTTLEERAVRHQLRGAVRRAVRLSHQLYATPVPDGWRAWRPADALFRARLLARNAWGQERRKLLRFAFYVRSHWLRMPPLMLARHLWTKARRGRQPG
ncbi:MAG TPA: nucleotidyltransferase family protein [Allosphingosinicella sp.]|nr:nucleotidyltransferase family protein [Allosphingosinicella sp.]